MDVSEDRSGKIWGLGNKLVKATNRIGSENAVFTQTKLRNLSGDIKVLKKIAFKIFFFDSSRVTDANGMFGECINLTALESD